MPILRGLAGVLALVALAWAMSSARRRFPLKTVLGGLALQWALALLVLKTSPGQSFFDGIGRGVTTILRGADAGAAFVFGPLAGDHPLVQWHGIAGIKILSTIIVVSALSAIGYHTGILQRVVTVMAWIMSRLLGVSGAESLSGAANVFLGQTEAPLLVKPYLERMSRSELMALMTGGFATVAAGVMAYYVSLLGGGDDARMVAVARHLLTASLMSAPAAFVIAKIMVPPALEPGGTDAHVAREIESTSLLDAATTGASDGMRLAINVIAMLIAFIAIITILDAVLGLIGSAGPVARACEAIGLERLSLDGLLGLLFAPVAWLTGIESGDRLEFGGLLGKAMATNEIIAYESLARLSSDGLISHRTWTIAIYSLCGFANFSSIGIQIGGISCIAPSRRADIVRLAPRAMLGGAMACWMTGCIAGALIGTFE